MSDDTVSRKLAALEADMRLVMVRLDRLEAVQGTGLSIAQALSALDRYDAQEAHDISIQRRMDALERMLVAYNRAMGDDSAGPATIINKPFDPMSDGVDRCEDCGAAPDDTHWPHCKALAEGFEGDFLSDTIANVPPDETPNVNADKYWAGGAPPRRKRTWRTLWM